MSALRLAVMLALPPLLSAAGEHTDPILFADDFAHGLNQWSIEQTDGGRAFLLDGSLIIEDSGGTTVWFRSSLTAPVEITYEAEVIDRGGPHDRVSDLNCFWMVQDPAQPPGALPAGRSGRFADYDNLRTYYVGYGGNNNTTTRFRRYDGTGQRPLLPAHDLRDRKFLLVPNHAYRIRIVVREGATEFWRDGERIFSCVDPMPLTSGYFAFRTVRSHLAIRNFAVKNQTTAPQQNAPSIGQDPVGSASNGRL